MKEYELKIKVQLESLDEKEFEEKIKKYFSDELTPELEESIRKLIFLRKPIRGGEEKWLMFKNYHAGLLPRAIMNRFDKSKSLDSYKSSVQHSSRAREEIIDLKASLDEDARKQFEKDPAPYIIKSIAGLDQNSAKTIWEHVLRESKGTE